ncbi:MAG: ABC transporter permease [Candidatus Sericytochromatia bacterium]|nr:ABC transporter permease [Candidatus Sericytochromatia bacterium]
MHPQTYAAIAFEALVLNKARSLLTMLGVIIGVFAVVVMIGLGQGSQAYVTNQVKGLGAGVLVVTPGNPRTQRGFGGGGLSGAQTLRLNDALAVQGLPGVRFASPQNFYQGLISIGRTSVGAQVIGTSPNAQGVRGLRLGDGRFFSDQEWRTGARVIVLGPSLARELFRETLTPPLDSRVRIGDQRFRVVGVLQGSTGAALGSTDDLGFIPTRAMQSLSDTGDRLLSILIKAESDEQLPGLLEQVRHVLRTRHGLRADDEDDFKIQSQADILATVTVVTGAFTVLLAGIAAISLLVGGIGIMNIMLVSVTERTREIGVRKAVGAKTGAILRQFLLEAGTVSLAGGTIGIVAGLLTIWAVTSYARLPFVFSPLALVGAFGFSAAVGVFFGAYPAAKAARLDPVEALRYE